ncbi:MAG: LysM peptidoglycan-binding domain-containing protein [Dehalococcoidia bacterium]
MQDIAKLISNRRVAVLGAFAAFGIALQGTAVVANAGNVLPVPQFLQVLQGYGYTEPEVPSSGGGAIIVAPPTGVVTEPGLAGSVTVTNSQTTPVTGGQTSTVQTTAPSGTTAGVTAPAGSLPAGSTVSVAAVSNTQALVAAAPPPAGVGMVAGFQINATSSTGGAITQLDAPVQVSFSVPADAVPAGATSGNVELAFWNGSDWVVTPATVTVNADGTMSVTASVTHFTLFAVLKQPDDAFGGTFAPTGKFNLMVWNGLTGTAVKDSTELVPGKVGAIYVLDLARQRFLTYIVGAPAGVSDSFTLTKGQPFIVRSPGQAAPTVATSTAAPTTSTTTTTAAPSTSTSSSARRTTTVQSGDTLTAIGARTGVDWQKIASLNNISGPAYMIQPGQTLFID